MENTDLLNPKEVARRLGVSQSYVYKLLRTRDKRRRLPGYRIGSLWRIPAQALEQFLADHSNLSFLEDGNTPSVFIYIAYGAQAILQTLTSLRVGVQ